jgi:hypothetical protein
MQSIPPQAPGVPRPGALPASAPCSAGRHAAALIVVSLVSAATGAALTALALRSEQAGQIAPGPAATPLTAQPPRPAGLPAEQDLPLTLIGPQGEVRELRLGVRHSRLNRYPEHSFYKLHAALANGWITEMRKIRTRLEALDESGAVLAAEAFDALGTHQAPLRPGDVHVFEHLLRVPPETSAARLVLELIDQDLASTDPAPARPLELHWPVEAPDRPPLEVRERQASAHENRLLGGVHVDVVFEVHNAGTGALRTVELEQRYFDRDGALLLKDAFLVASSSGAALLPGETRLYRSLAKLPETYHHYTLGVLRLE